MKMILHQDITIHFDPVALCAFSEIAQKLPSISIIPENLFPSISARHDVGDALLAGLAKGGSEPKPPKIPSPRFQLRHDRIQVDDLPVPC
jgi:hypothetical protein